LGHTRVNAFVFHAHSPLDATQLPPGRVPLSRQSASGNYCCFGQRSVETRPHPLAAVPGVGPTRCLTRAAGARPPDPSLQSTSLIAPQYRPPYTRPPLSRRRRGGTLVSARVDVRVGFGTARALALRFDWGPAFFAIAPPTRAHRSGPGDGRSQKSFHYP
jgi:hypothetical protein